MANSDRLAGPGVIAQPASGLVVQGIPVIRRFHAQPGCAGEPAHDRAEVRKRNRHHHDDAHEPFGQRGREHQLSPIGPHRSQQTAYTQSRPASPARQTRARTVEHRHGPGCAAMARKTIRSTQWPRIKSPSGSSRQRRTARTIPASASSRKPTGVTITVQTRVLYQGSDSLGVW